MSHRMIRGDGLCGLPDGHKGNHRAASSFTPEIVKKRNADWYERAKQRDPNFLSDRAAVARQRYWEDGRGLRNKYKRSMGDYKRVLAEQGGGCALCGKKPGKRLFHWDHDHRCCPGRITCGKCVRGIVCPRCNLFISFMETGPVAALISYLVRWGGDYGEVFAAIRHSSERSAS